MANIPATAPGGSTVYLKGSPTGTGTDASPYQALHGLENNSGTRINPATEEKQDALIALLPGSLGAALATASLPVALATDQLSTLATDSTLATRALESGGNLAAIATDAAAMEVLLTSIDTDIALLAGAVAGTEIQADIAALPTSRIFASDLVLDTLVYASGDTLADLLEVTDAVLSAGGTGTLQSISVVDSDNQGQPLDLVFFNQSVVVGTKNNPWAVSPADLAAANAQIVPIESADYKTVGSAKIATVTPPPIGIQPLSGSSIYVGTISRGSGTYTANGLRLILTIQRDG